MHSVALSPVSSITLLQKNPGRRSISGESKEVKASTLFQPRLRWRLIFVRPTKWLGRFLWKVGDGYIIDGFGPDGVSARVLDVTRNVVRLQTGYLYHYAFAMLIGVAALITWFMFVGGGH